MAHFQQIQQQFMAHIRDPQNQAAVEGIEERRLKIYRELFFNNVNSFVSSGFPVLRSLIDDEPWLKLVRRFFIEHDCHSPYFVDISKEFLKWLTDERDTQADDLPFMVELAHYEWVELEIGIRKERHHYKPIAPQQLTEATLVLSETAWPLSYSYPVHQISVDFMPTEGQPGSVHLIVYRDEDDAVQFMQINGVTAMLLQLLSDNPGATFEPLVEAMCEMLPQFTPEQLSEGALQVMEKLVERGIVRMTDRSPPP